MGESFRRVSERRVLEKAFVDMRTEKHCIVVVTYNRLNLLKECIEAIEEQLIKYDEVIIYNNASTDETSSYLHTLKNRDYFIVVNSRINQGGAGGFSRGIQIAYNRGADWITVIDDDAILQDDFHQQICKAIDESDDTEVCFAGVPLTNGIRPNHRRRVYGRFIKREMPVSIDEYTRPTFRCSIASFCGLVVSRRVIEMVGFPDRRFFIWYDDTEYTLRISKIKPIINCNRAIIQHKADTPDEQKLFSSWKEYYGIRNNIYTVRIHYGFPSALYLIVRKSCKCCVRITKMFLKDSKEKIPGEIVLYASAIYDGTRGRLGTNKTYYPVKEK